MEMTSLIYEGWSVGVGRKNFLNIFQSLYPTKVAFWMDIEIATQRFKKWRPFVVHHA